MRQFYQEELKKTLDRLQHIKTVLDQLGGDSGPSISIEVSGGIAQEAAVPQAIAVTAPASTQAPAAEGKKRRGRPKGSVNKVSKKVKKATSEEGGRPGRKSTWEPLIQQTLEKYLRPLTYDDLTEEVMQLGNIPEEKRGNTKQALQSVVFRVRRNTGEYQTLNLGGREKHIVLEEWLDKKGKLKAEFVQK